MNKRTKFGKRAFSAMAAAAVAAGIMAPAVMQVVPMTANAGQQLGQMNFDSGVGLPWHIVESAPGEMDFAIEDGVYKATIINPGGASNGGDDRWDCQFRHRGLKIVAGHQYQVKYEITASNSGKYYTKIGNLDGDVEIWHNMSTGEGDFSSHWDPIQINANETKKVELTFTASQSLEVAEWAFHLGGDGQYTPGGCFPAGTVITFDNMSLIDLTGDENDYINAFKWERAEVLTNQVGYFTDRAKRATLISDEKDGIDFNIKDKDGKTVYSGTSEYFGKDNDSDDTVHVIDFSDFKEEGVFTIEAENGAKSREFPIGGNEVYSELLYDSLNYFYQNRSGIEIESKYITSGDADALAREAGHTKDMAEIEQTWGYSGSSGSIDVTGGWYDAGDHGKYVVNGGLSLWLMQNQYETAKTFGFEKAYADGTMNIPENSNGAPDLLDEARWEMEWMLKMMVEDGEFEGMAYHKAHDEKWTALGIAPADDEMKRIVKPPTTAATLNLAACAAQAARLWKGIDDDFADKCLEAAKKAYDAAKANPKMFAPLDESIGGGAYGDDYVEDEFYWAASELFITTGDDKYHDDMESSDAFLKCPTTMDGGESVGANGSFDWGHVTALGTFSIALNKDAVDSGDYETAVENIIKASDDFIKLEEQQGYGLPYASSQISYEDKDKGYIWGSNSVVADNSVVLSYAYLLTKEEKYMDAALGGMDYLLGRNAMDYSYVTGYGTHSVENPHHRYWAGSIDESFPKAPKGVLSGGPNSGMQDPWVQGSGWKKGEIAPQKCYLDHIEAWSVNECTINWNASLAWLTGFVAQENGGIKADDKVNASDEKQEPSTEATTEAETTEPNTAEPDTQETTAATTEESENDEKEDKGNIAVVALIAAAVVIGLVSIEYFVYKLIKLRKK